MREIDRNLLPEPARVSPEECLTPTDVIESDHPLVREKAEEITSGVDGVTAKAEKLFLFVRDEIRYNFAPLLHTRDDWKASRTLARGDGFCQQKAVLFAALARAVGIPSQIAFQHLKDYKLLGTRYEPYMPDGVLPYHGLTVLYLNGRWLWEDATLDYGLCHRRRYRLVEFDPHDHALLPSTDLDGKPHFEFLGSFGPYPDMPRVITDAFANLEEWEKWQMLVKRTHITM